ncbi:MAG TPA: type II toxin-antitoxin system RelE/ParE family toxin [Candidatus Acidoferrum sp.]|nr:type II toxin-antitoxin system RelE/ParE family toxin [Candidatus Acidoferrum sp.]
MTLPVVWTPEANEDLLEARAWYDNIRPELGERFALAVEVTVEAIAEHPSQFAAVYRNHRRAGVRRFPYSVFFELQKHQVVVMACFHGRRNPRRWQSR